MDSDSKPSSGKKEKKTRRRLRLSCVECTKRRQKCDRNYPCSLCVTRGVSHLCRWESVPVARPPPARPPTTPSKPIGGDGSTIQALVARVAFLEQALAASQQAHAPRLQERSPVFSDSPQSAMTLVDNISPRASPVPAPSQHSSYSPEPSDDSAYDNDVLQTFMVPPLAQDIYDATSTLAQLALGHHGEYIGRGSLICALYSISAEKTPRFLYAKSTDATSARRETQICSSPATNVNTIEGLLEGIPPRPITTAMVNAFFADINWRFGIPEKWFHTACAEMWDALKCPGDPDHRVNANWLFLFFTVLAYAPRDLPEVDQGTEYTLGASEDYFVRAMNAQRIADYDYLRRPSVSLMVSAADGTVLACLAVSVMCNYLAERGRVSEAWKLIGVGLRNAEAVGMHRDPGWRLWQVMSEDERLLRRRAWWGLVIWDKLYSFILGRPQMTRKEMFDVAAPPYIEDGSRNLFNLSQAVFIQLSTIIGETLEKCFSVDFPDCPVFFEQDYKLQQWQANLPPELQFEEDRPTPTEHASLSRQRYVLTTWYLLTRVKLHIAATISSQDRASQSPVYINESRRICIVLAMKLVRLQCDTYETCCKDGKRLLDADGNWFFEGCFSLFEAAVALMAIMTRYPWPEKANEAAALIERALVVFMRAIREEKHGSKNDIAHRAVEVLTMLRQESWWRAHSTGLPVDDKGSSQTMAPVSPHCMFGAGQPANLLPSADIFQWYLNPSTPGNPGQSVQYSISAVRDSSHADGFQFHANEPPTASNGRDVDMYTHR